MIGESLKNKIVKIALETIDKKIGKKFPIIDEITDVFQEQDKRFKDIETQIYEIKEKQNAKTCCCNKKDCC
tara:strand:+ start:236 stop:448 length:213 start_codon:yes stop_codon:yes gene_type:complete